MTRIVDIIRKKRDGQELEEAEIRRVIAGVTDGSLPDYQTTALLMAVFFRGLTDNELTVWTDAMLRSGEVLDLSLVPGVKVDKHSTGGVGDKVSLALAPLVAAAGVPVPMISGRGLGHTGGTLDKLEAIPGFRVDLPADRFIQQVRSVGTSMIGQTAQLAPADRRLYALRDVTGTVESIPLISASIMSKKLASGIDGLVLDVKVGRGAFMKDQDSAFKLAQTLVGLGRRAGKRVWAVLTAMEEPLGLAVGNALETAEAFAVLQGGGPPDLVEVTLELAARMLVLGDRAANLDRARELLQETIASGAAQRCLKDMIRAQHGDVEVVDHPERLPRASFSQSVTAERTGFVQRIDAEAVGLAAMSLGAGRERAEDAVDPAVGVLMERKVGAEVTKGQTMAVIHGNDQAKMEQAARQVLQAVVIGERPPTKTALMLDEIAP